MAIDPDNGNPFFQFAFGSRGPTVNAASPLMLDESHLFLTASYGVGAYYTEVGILGAKPIWDKDGLLSSQYTTPIEDQGLLYGIHGREDGPPADLVCIDPRLVKQSTNAAALKWTEQSFGYATLIKADGKLLCVKTNGELVLVRISDAKFDSLGRAKLATGTIRALPALANGHLYVRNESRLFCYDLGR